jgi:hypothetical protein
MEMRYLVAAREAFMIAINSCQGPGPMPMIPPRTFYALGALCLMTFAQMI